MLPATGGAVAAILPAEVAMPPLAALWWPLRLPPLALPLVGPPGPSGLLKAGSNFDLIQRLIIVAECLYHSFTPDPYYKLL